MKRLIYIILVGFCLAACTTSKQTDSKEHILVWQLYNFRNQNIHDKLLSIVEDAFNEDSFDALFIEYTQLTTIGTYGQDSTPYHYNLLIQTIHDDYSPQRYKTISENSIGCCMIGDYLCYISNNKITASRLFLKTSDTVSDTIRTTEDECFCYEEAAYCLIDNKEHIFYKKLNDDFQIQIAIW